MNDLEERLRADLQQATAGVEDSVDVDAVLLAGQGARSTRRVARTVGVVALAAAVGMVGWGFVKAAPVLGGHPDPMGTVSAVPSVPSTSASPYLPTDPMAARFELDGKLNGQVDTYDSIGVSVKPAGNQVEVTVSLNAAKQSIVRHYTFMSGAFWWVALDKHFVLSIVPGRPTWFQAVDDAAKGAIGDQVPLVGINATAYLTGFIQSGGPDTVRGFMWRGADGIAQDSLGKVVPSAELALADDSYFVYRDEALDIMGIDPGKDSGGYSFRISDVKAGDLVHGGVGSRQNGGLWSWTQFGTLPPGAHDINVVMADPAGEWGTTTLSDGWVFVLAHAQTKASNVIRSISYTDADGNVVSRHS